LKRIGRDFRQHHDQAIDAPAHRSDRTRRFGRAAVAGRDEQMKAAGAGSCVSSPQQFGEELAVKVRQDHADRVGATVDQASCTFMGNVAEPSSGRQNSGAGSFTNAADTIQNAGHGGNGDVRLACHVLDGDGPQRGPSTSGPAALQPIIAPVLACFASLFVQDRST
jgi:hypothetical protein